MNTTLEKIPASDPVSALLNSIPPVPPGLSKELRDMPKSSREFLNRAICVQEQRAQEYDQPDGERSMEKVVAAFNLLTGHELKESDGWLLQQILKLVRDQSRVEPHQDSLLDNVGYGSLYAEARMAGK